MARQKERHPIVEKMRQRRKELGISQVEHADLADLPIETLKCWEYMQRTPILTKLEKAAKALGLRVELVEM